MSTAGCASLLPLPLPPSAPVRCWFCGGPEVLELAEMWGHRFMWETCCEGLHESLCREVVDDPAWGRELLRRLGAEALTGHRLRRVADDARAGWATGGCQVAGKRDGLAGRESFLAFAASSDR